VPLPPATEAMRIGQQPKPILLALGAVDPPAMPQVLPLGVARIGQLALVAGPAEFTTMSGRRFRQAIKHVIPAVKYVAVAGYASDYAGYVATREEYELQHYEGAATLFGPWTQAAYQQEFARLAADMAARRASDSHEPPLEMRGAVRPTPLGTKYDQPPPDATFGDLVQDAPATCQRGAPLTVSFWTGDPRNGYRPDRRYAAIQHRVDGQWQTVATAGDWEITCRWTQPRAAKGSNGKLAARQIAIEWDVPADTAPGEYRVVHDGVFKDQGSRNVHEFETSSRSFEVQ
jgi:neutral ceramidase